MKTVLKNIQLIPVAIHCFLKEHSGDFKTERVANGLQSIPFSKAKS